MSKIYVAFTNNGSRQVSGSLTTLRGKVKVFPETQWSVYLYDLKPNVDTLITLMEGDLSKLPTPEVVEHWRTTKSGQVRNHDPNNPTE